MASGSFVEEIFGASVVSDDYISRLQEQHLKAFPQLLAEVYTIYGGYDCEKMVKSFKASKIIAGTNSPSLVSTVLIALCSKTGSQFVEFFTDSKMSFNDKLKVQQLMKHLLIVKDRV